jgi:hypothetical protein
MNGEVKMENEAVLGYDAVANPRVVYLKSAPITENCKRSRVLNYILFPRLPYTENICNRFPRRGKYSQVALSKYTSPVHAVVLGPLLFGALKNDSQM